MDPVFINMVLSSTLLLGIFVCVALFFSEGTTLNLKQRTLVLMSRMGVLVAVVSGLFFAASLFKFDMDGCTRMGCYALIESANMILNNRYFFAVGSIIGIIVAPLSLYALERDFAEKESLEFRKCFLMKQENS